MRAVAERTPRDTSRMDDGDRWGMLLGGERAILAQESQGQREMVNATTLPTDLRGDEAALVALGFTFGDKVDGDPMFRAATIPDGWKREGSEHAMWSYVVDDLGRQRVSVFYKAAFYDRSAHASLNTVYGYVSSCLYDDTLPVLDDAWATQAAVIEALDNLRSRESERVELWTKHGNQEHINEARAEIAKIDALALRVQQDGGAS